MKPSIVLLSVLFCGCGPRHYVHHGDLVGYEQTFGPGKLTNHSYIFTYVEDSPGHNAIIFEPPHDSHNQNSDIQGTQEQRCTKLKVTIHNDHVVEWDCKPQ